MWKGDELSLARVAEDVAKGLFYVAECDGEIAGTIKFQLEDKLFWPDVSQEESAFVHRLAVRRRFAGGVVSSALLRWAVERAASLGRRYLRLDCEASRGRLRQVYERFGFRHHSDRYVGPYFVSRYQYEIRERAYNYIVESVITHDVDGTGRPELASLIKRETFMLLYTCKALMLERPPTEDGVRWWGTLLGQIEIVAKHRRLDESGIAALRSRNRQDVRSISEGKARKF